MPVDPATLGAFALAATAIVVSPGPDTLLILRYALGSGRPAGLAAVAGVQLGLCAHTALAATGLSALIASSPGLFRAMAIAGAAYLGWIGVQALRGGVTSPSAVVESGTAAAGAAARRALRDALLCNVLNPKVVVLFLALYPNFLRPDRGDPVAQILTLSAVLVAINVAWQAPMAVFAGAARSRLLRPSIQRALGRATGAALLVFAALMLWEHAVGGSVEVETAIASASMADHAGSR